MSRSLLAAFAPLVVLATPAGDLGFRPAKDTELVKTLHEETTLELDSLLQSFGGAVVADEAVPMETSLVRTVIVQDVYGETDADGPLRLERTFQELSVVGDGEAEIQSESEGFAVELGSDLTDRTIVFERDDEGEYDVGFPEGAGGPNGLLVNHDVDMDLRGLLPEDGVSEGDSWEVEDESLRTLIAMGGAPPMRVDDLEGEWRYLMPSDALSMGIAHLAESAQDVTGKARVTWERTLEEDGRRLAILELELEVEAEATLDDTIRTMMIEAGVSDDRKQLTLATNWTLDGKGRVEWDLDAGHFRSAALEGDVEVTVEMTWVQERGGMELEFIGEYGLVGTTSIQASVE